MEIPEEIISLVTDRMDFIENLINDLDSEADKIKARIDELSTEYVKLAEYVSFTDTEANKPIPVIEKPIEKPKTITEISREAKKLGLSYGKYLQYQKEGRIKDGVVIEG